jgi:predicted  nucleic acid-binding Zn-ribbon protein
MSSTAEILRELHRIHRQLADLKERRERGPKSIKARETNLARLEADLAASRDKIKHAHVSADQKQLQLKTGESKIVDLKTKLNAANSNREYQALMEQIAASEMTNSVMEDEILEALEKIEQLQIAAAEAEKNLAEGRQNLEKTKQTVSEQAVSINADITRLEAELAEGEKNLPSDFRLEYDRVVRTRGEAALAQIEDDCCGGCNRRISANMISKLMMDHVICCTSCGCILYFQEKK